LIDLDNDLITKAGIYAYSETLTGGTKVKATFSDFQMEAIPEPATLGMISLFAGGILFIRRRFML